VNAMKITVKIANNCSSAVIQSKFTAVWNGQSFLTVEHHGGRLASIVSSRSQVMELVIEYEMMIVTIFICFSTFFRMSKFTLFDFQKCCTRILTCLGFFFGGFLDNFL
jgi:hypothetical protein